MKTLRDAWDERPVLALALLLAAAVALAAIDGDVLVAVIRALTAAAATEYDRVGSMPADGHPLE